MPPNNASAPSQHSSSRKTTERVVPAIPLALSKAKPPKTKSKVDLGAKAGAERQNVDVQPSDVLDDPQEQLLSLVSGLNGVGYRQTEPAPLQKSTALDNAVTMPMAGTLGSRGSVAMSLSFGGTPEMPTTDSPPPLATPPPALQAQSQITAVSPASSRKSIDMRQIRTELPPAFIPSAEQHTPKSATSSQFSRPITSRPHAHPSQPSTNSIVFGSQDSTTSSPAPPQSTGSAYASPIYPAFGSAQQPYFVPQGHAHHVSEPHYRSHHTNYAQPATAWHARQGYGPPVQQTPGFHPQNHMPFRYPSRDIFTPAGSQYINGHTSRSRSASQASSAAPEQYRAAKNDASPLTPGPETLAGSTKTMRSPDSKTTFRGQPHSHQAQFHPQMLPPPPLQHPDIAASIANAEAMRDHVLTSFSIPTLADCQLVITDEYTEHEFNLDGHRILLYRSPTLLDLIQNHASSMNGSLANATTVRLKGQYLRTSTLVDAIKYLYGGPLLQLDHQRPGSAGGEHIPSNVERMETALQNIAVGAWLKVPQIVHRGVEVATGLLHWETIANALSFSLDGGLSQIWNIEDIGEDRGSVSSSDDSIGRAEPASSPTYEPYSTHLLTRIVDFIVLVFPTNFYLDVAAPQLASCPRLPPVGIKAESRASRSDPRLSQIRFGDVPIEDHQRPSFATTTVSSVLLSLPFQILKFVLENPELAARLGPETAASIMRQVVAEREVRRIKAFNSATTLHNDPADSPLVHNLFWEESVEPSPSHRAGFRLVRQKRDIDTPPSSGACSERNK